MGTAQRGGVRRFSFPRSDIQVTARGVALRPAFALGPWAAFLPMRRPFMVMGDLVLKESEIDSVVDALQRNGVEQTAIPHHVLNEAPR